MNTRRVVITGMGAVTPIGNDVPTFWSNLIAGKSGIGHVTAFDTTTYDCKIGGEVKNFDPSIHFSNPKDARRADRYTHMAMASAKEAYAQSALAQSSYDPTRAGVIYGSGIGGLKSLSDQHEILLQKGPGRISPFMIPMMISNIASGIIAMEIQFSGPNYAVVTACATGAQCIGEAWRLIRDDEADIILAGGSEAAVVPLGLGGFAAMRALSLRNDAPEKASRPFDKDRDGFVLAEGAGALILEEYEHARRRGANILAEITGYGLSADAYHMTSPDPEGRGAARAMKNALRHARLNPEDLGYINAHGTSTPQGDICETLAIKAILGEYARKVPISSTKSMTGHTLGAAGAIELIACVQAIRTSTLPPTINLDNPDPECDLDYIPNTARSATITTAMSNSFGFGGHNAAIIVQKI